MSDELLLRWTKGLDNVSPDGARDWGALSRADNVDIDRAGSVARRAGYTRIAAVLAHSAWTSPARGDSFAIVDGALCRVRYPWSVTEIAQLTADLPASYDDVNGDVIVSTRHDLLAIAPDFTVRRVGLETPGIAAVRAETHGGLAAGTYGVAAAFLRGAEEGQLCEAQFIEIGEGGGIGIDLQPASEDLPTAVRLYRTQANGDVLYRSRDVPVGLEGFTLGVDPIGRQAKTQYLERMVPGEIVRLWRGMLWTARGSTAFHSEPLRYGVYAPHLNHVPLGAPVRLFEPVEGGIFVGTREGIFFLAGRGPSQFEVRPLDGAPPVKGSAIRVPGSLLGDYAKTDKRVPIWLAGNGYVIGMPDGSLIEPHAARIRLPATGGAAAAVVRGRQIITVVS